MHAYLKVKICSLAEEQRIIRRLERRLKKRRQGRPAISQEHPELDKRSTTFWGLRHHRLGLRSVARHSNLAYGFLRGVPYEAMEAKCWDKPDLDRVEADVVKFAAPDRDKRELMQTWAAWKAGAMTHADAARRELINNSLFRRQAAAERYAKRNTNEERARRAAGRAVES